MAVFRYAALQATGRVRSGLVEAETQDAALRLLSARGETPVRIKPARGGAGRARIPRRELATFLADLAALHDAGVPLRRALDVLASGASTARAAQLARLMAERLDAGSDVGRAASLSGTADLAFAAELARAGEASGKLGDALRFAADMLRRQDEFARRIGGALAYPAFLLFLSLMAIIALAAIAGPAIAPLLEGAPNPPEGLTFVLGLGTALQEHGAIILAGLVATIVGMILASRTAPVRTALAAARARAPFLGAIVRDINCGAFARILGALLSGGASAVIAMDLAANAAPNTLWRGRFREAGQSLRDGRTIAAALASLPGASPELARLTKVGEASGAVGEMLSRAGNIAVERALRRLDQAAAAAGPVLILAMGGFTGWLMSAFLTGLSQLGEGTI
ncbi:MAG: type II secretion system F family protein [Hyphomonadaceae bacterium]|nr:type II secretion system F family protein [Hyphomonadaceae bacterium]